VADPVYRGRWAQVRRHVLDRDGWVCQLCGAPIDPHARPRSAMSASVDHVVPASAGGDWWEPGNLRAAHLVCNSVRANRSRSRPAPRRRYDPPRAW
jgi:5-methylcytosine-specific restriction endonuclease McrA